MITIFFEAVKCASKFLHDDSPKAARLGERELTR